MDAHLGYAHTKLLMIARHFKDALILVVIKIGIN